MFQSVGFCDFTDAFRAHDRQDQFTYDGLRILFDYLEEYEDSTGEKIELDVIALCCDYREYTLEDINREYQEEFDTLEDAEEWIQNQTSVAGKTDDAIVFACF